MKNLIQIIKDNPGCVFIVDNDYWYCIPPKPKNAEEYDEIWQEWRGVTLIDSDEVASHNSGYGSGSLYGGDILQALAKIVGVKIESV